MSLPLNQIAPALLPSPATGKVEIVWEHDEAAPRVSLQYSTWVENLGWCPQKTMPVPLDQLDELHRALTVVRHRVKRRQADAGAPPVSAKVIHVAF